jgi:predicted nucleotidyltransferase
VSEAPTDLHDDVILLGLAGSRAHGLERPDSDYDWRGVFMSSLRTILGVKGEPETINLDDPDVDLHEVGKFVKLAAKSNPHALEVLWLPEYEQITKEGEYLVEHRDTFLSEKGIRSSYQGFCRTHFQRLQKETTPERRAKTLRHMFRVAEQGISLLADGTMSLKVADPERLAMLSRAENDVVTREWSRMSTLIAHLPTDLPKAVDLDAASEILYNIRIHPLEGTPQ